GDHREGERAGAGRGGAADELAAGTDLFGHAGSPVGVESWNRAFTALGSAGASRRTARRRRQFSILTGSATDVILPTSGRGFTRITPTASRPSASSEEPHPDLEQLLDLRDDPLVLDEHE